MGAHHFDDELSMLNADFSVYRDRIRTAVNVLGDSIGAGIIHHTSKKDLPELPGHPDLEVGNDNEVAKPPYQDDTHF